MTASPITDTSKVLDLSRVLDTQAVTKAPVGDERKPAAKSAISTLFLYDSSSEAELARIADPLRKAFYGDAKPVGVKAWEGLQREIAVYATIETLVLLFHGDAGGLEVAKEQRRVDYVRDLFAATGTKVAGAIKFESCVVMRDPAAAAEMVVGIAGDAAIATGYTYYLCVQDVPVPASTGREEVEAILAGYRDWLLPDTPSAERLADSKTDQRFWIRFFRPIDDDTPLSPREPTGLRPKDVFTFEALERKAVSTRDEAEEYAKEVMPLTPPAAFVTIKNAAKVGARPAVPAAP